VHFTAKAYDKVGNVGFSADVPVTVAVCMEALPTQTPVNGQFSSVPLAVVVDGQDRPIVAWREYTSSGIYLRRWSGSAWEAFAPPLVPAYNVSNYPFTLQLDSQGRPVVVYLDYNSTNGASLFVAQRWTGTSWTQIGGGPGDATGWQTFGFASTMLGDDPLIAWSSYRGPVSPFFRIRVSQAGASTWTELGNGMFRDSPQYYLYGPSIALGAGGDPVVAFSEFSSPSNTDRHVYVSSWDGTSWVPLGNEVELAQTYYPWPSVAVDGTGAPAVGWLTSDTSYSTAFSASRWNGSAWTPLGVAYPFAQTIAYNDGVLQMVFNRVKGRFAAALVLDAASVLGAGGALLEYDATGWNPTCGYLVDSFETSGYASYLNAIAVAVDSQGRYVVAAYSTTRDKVHVLRIAPR
jgi:hypothetical protein